MAEQEIIKHTKKIFTTWGNRKHGFWHKLKDFIFEIFIIVFAITVSLWLHNWSEHRHQQAEVKDFMLGLKEDLKADIAEMQDDMESFLGQKAAFSYINNLKLRDTLKRDSLSRYYAFILNTTGLNPNNGRFEGFKSSGRIGDIENRTLQNDIMDLYQEDIPSLLNSTNGYLERKKKLFEYLLENNKRLTDSTSNITTILNTEEAHNISATLVFTEEITGRYTHALNKMKKIIAAIDEQYSRE